MKNMKKSHKSILLAITGGIAAYKSAELVRLLKKEKYNVKVVMTENAMRFITPLTMAVLSENKVYTNLFSPEKEDEEIRHISLAHWADLIIIAPSTANIISKIAHGIADDLLTSTVLAFQGHVVLAPSMNTVMIQNPIYQKNVESLKKLGYHFINTIEGGLACGDYGDGRMSDPQNILRVINERFSEEDFLKDKKVLITASSTREPIDNIRFISNYSTGKMGFALAKVAKRYGAEVILITGPTHLADIVGVRTIHVNTAKDMREKVMAFFDNADIFISAAAVSDFKPSIPFSGKIKKDKQKLDYLKLEKNIDILHEAGRKKSKQILVGFAAEIKDLEENALSKLKEKNLDYIVGNDVSRKDSGFGTDTNKVLIIDCSGKKTNLPLMTKYKVAEHIFKKIKEHFPEKEIKA